MEIVANNQQPNTTVGEDHSEYRELADDLLRTMRITTNARFEASKRLRLINTLSFLTTTLASLGLILIPLLDIAKINHFFSNITLTVFQIFLAVCVLVYSTAIATANYQVRSKEYLECGDKIKSIVNDFKVHLIDARSDNKAPDLKKYMDAYKDALVGTENHEDVDYSKASAAYNAKARAKKDPNYVEPIVTKSTLEQLKNKKIYLPFLAILLLEVGFIGIILISKIWYMFNKSEEFIFIFPSFNIYF